MDRFKKQRGLKSAGNAELLQTILSTLHKAHQFLGMQALPTFLCADVMKQPNIEGDVARYREHLARVFVQSHNPSTDMPA